MTTSAMAKVAVAIWFSFATGRNLLGAREVECEAYSVYSQFPDEAKCAFRDPETGAVVQTLSYLQPSGVNKNIVKVYEDMRNVQFYQVSLSTVVCLDDADERFCQVTAKDGMLKAEKVKSPMYSLPAMQATESIASFCDAYSVYSNFPDEAMCTFRDPETGSVDQTYLYLEQTEDNKDIVKVDEA